MKKTIKVAIALLLGLMSPAMAQDIKVGTIFPLSGGAGPDGQSVTNAVKLAIEQINEKGGLLGRKITLISKDDESTPAVGVSRANEMIAEKVDVVIEGSARAIIIVHIGQQHMAQMALAEHHDMIEAFPADRADQPLCVCVLPG